ncbi:ScbA/BarX family gamma-butyrolactone biosynthesis protein [Nocardia spumae]|uniref:ScbA/BarX family gamma-butyrolactone biosynthesis protein n=1 Tax=Nocardia spumae TaxID=2887190 RepID=UPI001D138D6B|nr:ScbA/BarX family gamma-butyrolactone biosynthesis protein [Nocardia spumae]
MTTDATAVDTASHVHTISRHLAHRCAVAEVFVTSLQRVGTDDFVVGAQLPRMHAFYGDHRPPWDAEHDPMLVMEAARQAAIALTHEYLGVPQDFGFIVRTFNGAVAAGDGWRIGSAPADLVMSVQISRRHRRGEVLHGVDMVLEIECGDEPLMIVDGSFTWVPPARWTAMRAGFRDSMGLGEIGDPMPVGERAEPPAVGRGDRRNVVVGPVRIAEAELTADLVIDTGHPILFDHPVDHVPGSLLLEAARQTATAISPAPPRRLIGVSSSFERFVELDRRTEGVARISNSVPGQIDCEIVQCGAVAARIGLRYETDEAEC